MVDHNDPVLNTLMIGLTANCPNLNKLQLEGCNVDTSLRSLIASSKQLRNIRLRYCSGWQQIDWHGVTCASLKDLRLCGAVPHDTVEDLLKAFPSIKWFWRSVDVANTTQYPDTVCTFNLWRCDIVQEFAGKNITHLALVECNLSDDILFRVLQGASNVVSLNVRGNTHLTGESWMEQADHFITTIQRIKLDQCAGLEEHILISFLTNCTALHTCVWSIRATSAYISVWMTSSQAIFPPAHWMLCLCSPKCQ